MNPFIFFPKPTIGNEEKLLHYQHFITSRLFRKLPEGPKTEIHHILPRKLGGCDCVFNKIELSTREHYIAHLILWKCGFEGMQNALWLMVHTKRGIKVMTSRQYSLLKEDYSKKQSDRVSGNKNPRFGKNWKEGKTPEEIEKINKSKGRKGADNKMFGRKYSPEQLANHIANHSKLRGSDHPLHGKKQTPEHIQKAKEARLLKPNPRSRPIWCVQKGKCYSSITLGALECYGDSKYKNRILISLNNGKPCFGYLWYYINSNSNTPIVKEPLPVQDKPLRTPTTLEQIEEIEKMIQRGEAITKISRQVGLTPTVVRARIKKFRLDKN